MPSTKQERKGKAKDLFWSAYNKTWGEDILLFLSKCQDSKHFRNGRR